MIRALLRKDLLLHWVITVAGMVLLTANVAVQGSDADRVPEIVWIYLPIITWVTVLFMIVSVIQADAPAGTRHEWLTRSVPSPVVFAAKAIYIAVAIVVPTLLGSTIACILGDLSWGETALVATAIPWDTIMFVPVGVVLAVITATLLEALIVGVAGLAVTMFVSPLTQRLSGTGPELFTSGVAWIAVEPRVVFAIVMSGVVIWLAYAGRRIRLARILFGGAIAVLAFSPVLSPWSTVFGIQKALSADPRRADGVTLTVDGACLPAIVVNPSGDSRGGDDDPAWANEGQPVRISSRLWDEGARRAAGADAIGMETPVALSGAPDRWRTLIGHVAAVFETNGSSAYVASPAQHQPSLQKIDLGTQLASHFWLLPRETAVRLALTPGKWVIDYSVSLLRPVQSTEIEVGAPRGYLDDFGYCGARFDRATSTIEVDCYERSARPAQFTANLAGASADLERAGGSPDFTPAAFELFTGRRQIVTLRNVPEDRAARVTLTNYEAVAHFDRSVVIDGVLGGSAAACPLPRPRVAKGP
jgi:hypothetical protein